MASLWMGDVDGFMDEKFISQAFAAVGENITGVKLIRNRMVGNLPGYCFVHFPDEESAQRCLRKLNGQPMPGASYTNRFKLNFATYAKAKDASPTTKPQPTTNEFGKPYSYYELQYQQYSNWKPDQKNNYYSYQQQFNYNQNTWQTSEQAEVEALEDPASQLDINEANKEFMEQSEELYDALMDCHWQPLDSVTSKIPVDT
ncbi:hypothetical protein GDO86_012160 [Hymenochirus boettgeri]|uniref:tRNA selenocysteine 1-associated protein 1 n=1 Tax=Hymenochirus boettgeri TaxID=247094 RepID=A0A8T2ILG0_9PIPI|nr:hypothetical protein GDO86_012160 [Hymenochirus boettgeri]KAG8433699.1 hypothetical protein GDO86_012160 [Hymenochirus boettgeri]